jgi:hypothetical protein
MDSLRSVGFAPALTDEKGKTRTQNGVAKVNSQSPLVLPSINVST